MAKNNEITRQIILDTAYSQAQRNGIASLSIRGIASECGVAIGSIYHHFPDKAALVTEVIASFWERAARGTEGVSCFRYRPGQNLVGFCKQIAAGLEGALMEFRSDWLVEIENLDARTLARGHQAEQACFRHIVEGFQVAIAQDPSIDQCVVEEIGSERLARFIWSNMLQALKEGDSSCATLITILRRSLYR